MSPFLCHGRWDLLHLLRTRRRADPRTCAQGRRFGGSGEEGAQRDRSGDSGVSGGGVREGAAGRVWRRLFGWAPRLPPGSVPRISEVRAHRGSRPRGSTISGGVNPTGELPRRSFAPVTGGPSSERQGRDGAAGDAVSLEDGPADQVGASRSMQLRRQARTLAAGSLHVGGADQAAGRSRSPAMRCIAFCSFSKARTSIWRMRSRLTS